MDLQQVVAQGASGSVEIVELGAIADADIVVISASVPLTVNDTRMVYLRDNAAIVAEIGDALPEGWPGVALMVTNPVDPLCTLLWRRRARPPAAARLHRQRQPAPAHRDRRPARRPLERGRRVGARRARRPLRAAARPRPRRRHAGRPQRHGGRGGRALRAALVRAARRARLRPLVDVDDRARARPHGRGAHQRRGRAVAGLGRARGRVRRVRRRAQRAGHDRRAAGFASCTSGSSPTEQRAAMAAAGEAVRAAADAL